MQELQRPRLHPKHGQPALQTIGTEQRFISSPADR